MRTLFAAAVAVMAITGAALGQTQPTRPSSAATGPTLPAQAARPNSLCYSTASEPCSSLGAPAGTSVNVPADSHVSFAVAQAKSRIEAAGYADLTDLQQDVRGNWHGKAVKNGKTVYVTLGFGGNLTAAHSPGQPIHFHAFTANQAKSRIESDGYSGVIGLQRDPRGVWHGNAIKDGRPVSVTLDFEGNITE